MLNKEERMLERADKKKLFLERYALSLKKGASMQGLFVFDTFYKWMRKDPKFAKDVIDIEMRIVEDAEAKYRELLNAESEDVQFKVAKEIINSKLGKKYSNLAIDDKDKLNIKIKEIKYKVNND